MIATAVAGIVLAGCSSSSKSAGSDTTSTTAEAKPIPDVAITAADYTLATPSGRLCQRDARQPGKEGHQIGFVKLGR